MLATLLVSLFAPMGIIELAVDDTLCRKRGLTMYGTGMHHDPLISSRAKPLTSWGHDWVVLTLIVKHPWWAPSKVWSLPLAFRLYCNHQGITKGKKKALEPEAAQGQGDSLHRTRPQLAAELITLVASWFPERQLMVTGDSAYGGQSVLKKLPGNVDLISHVHPKGALYQPAPAPQPGQKGRRQKKGDRLPGMARMGCGRTTALDGTAVLPMKATLRVQSQQALYSRTYWTKGRTKCSTAPGSIGKSCRATPDAGRSKSSNRTPPSSAWSYQLAA